MVLKDWNDKNKYCFKVIIQVNLELKYFAEAKFCCQQAPAVSNQRTQVRH